MKRIILINLSLIIFLIIFSELFVRFFKLSGIMGIDSNLLIERENTYGFKKNSKGKVYGKLIYTDSDGFRIPNKEFNYQKNKPSIFLILSCIFDKSSMEILIVKVMFGYSFVILSAKFFTLSGKLPLVVI